MLQKPLMDERSTWGLPQTPAAKTGSTRCHEEEPEPESEPSGRNPAGASPDPVDSSIQTTDDRQWFCGDVLYTWVWRPLSLLLLYPVCAAMVVAYLFHAGNDWGPALFSCVCAAAFASWLVANVLVVGLKIELQVFVGVVVLLLFALYHISNTNDEEVQFKWGAIFAALIGVAVRLTSLFLLRTTLEAEHDKAFEYARRRLTDAKDSHDALPLVVGSRVVYQPRIDDDQSKVGIYEGTKRSKTSNDNVEREYMVRILEENPQGLEYESSKELKKENFAFGYPNPERLTPGQWALLSKDGHRQFFYDDVKTQIVRDIFERTVWICQGALAFGLAFRYHVGFNVQKLVTLPQEMLTSTEIDLLSNVSVKTEQLDPTAASSQVLYPFFVFLFLAVLRLWETVSEERSNLLHEEDELLMNMYTWTINWIATDKGLWCCKWYKVGGCLCCCSKTRRNEISTRAKILRMRKEALVNNATHSLDLVDSGEAAARRNSVQGKQSSRSKQSSTDSRRLHELKCSFVEGAWYPQFTKYGSSETDYTDKETEFRRRAKQLVPGKSVNFTLWRLRSVTANAEGAAARQGTDEEEMPKGALSGQHVIRAILQHRIGPIYGIRYVDANNHSHHRVDEREPKPSGRPTPEPAELETPPQAVADPSGIVGSAAQQEDPLALLKIPLKELRQRAQGVGLTTEELEEAACETDQRGYLIPKILASRQSASTGTGSTYLRGSDLVRLIILLSKADQIILHRTCWWVVVFTSLLHATLPLLWSMRELCVPLPDVDSGAACTRAQSSIHVGQACMAAAEQCQYHGWFERWKHLDTECDTDPTDVFCSARGHTLLNLGAWFMSVGSILGIADLVLELTTADDNKGGLKNAHKSKTTGLYIVIWATLIAATCCLAVLIFYHSGFKLIFKTYAVVVVVFLGLGFGYDLRMFKSRARLCTGGAACAAVLAVVSVFGDSPQHTLGFFLSYWMTFSLTVRLSKCFEDVYEKYHRMLYFLHLTPWSTLKQKHRIETYGLLPEFGLHTCGNIDTWSKMRLFLERYDIKWDRERQGSVVWMLGAWVIVAFYQLSKYVNPNESSTDTESILVISSTFQLSVGISLILFFGNRTNELQSVGMEHMLRVKQAETISKGVMYITEHMQCEAAKSTLSDPEKQFWKASSGESTFTPVDRVSASAGAALNPFPSSPGAAVTHEQSESNMASTAEWLRELDKHQGKSPPREFHMLEALIETVKNEHSNGGKEHWGAEDRRATLLGIIVMDRTKLYTFWSSVITVIIPVAYKGLVTVFSDEAKSIIDDLTQNWTCSDIAKEILRDRAS